MSTNCPLPNHFPKFPVKSPCTCSSTVLSIKEISRPLLSVYLSDLGCILQDFENVHNLNEIFRCGNHLSELKIVTIIAKEQSTVKFQSVNRLIQMLRNMNGCWTRNMSGLFFSQKGLFFQLEQASNYIHNFELFAKYMTKIIEPGIISDDLTWLLFTFLRTDLQ